MIYPFRNTEADFLRWCQRLLPQALSDLESFSKGQLDIHQYRELYDDAIRLKRQYVTIGLYLDPMHSEFFTKVLLAGKMPDCSPIERELYREIFSIWQAVCFPQGKINIKALDSVLLGGELKRLRLEHNFSTNQVANLVSIAEKTLYGYEEGNSLPKLDIFYRLCSLYSVSASDILGVAEVPMLVNVGSGVYNHV